jgi:DNA-binding MarR family transcriptional regulator
LFYIKQNAGRTFLDKRRSVGKSVRSLNNLIMRRFDSNRPDREALERVTNANRWVISFLVEQQNNGKDVYQKDLETAFCITRSTISKVIDLMIQKDLIRRMPVAHDARLKKLVLTQKAMELSEKMRIYADGVEREITAGFSDKELDTLFEYIDRMKKNLGEI